MSGRSLVWLCIMVTIATMFYKLGPMVAEQDSVYRTYAPLVEVDALIQRQFVQPVRGRRLIDGAIRGMMLQLDRYSGYVSPDEMQAFLRRHSNGYVGIGVELGVVQDAVMVISPTEHGPAAVAGVRPGDVILNIDGRSTKDLSAFDVEGMLIGESGTRVTLTVRHASGETEDLTIERAFVAFTPVKGVSKDASGEWDFMLDPVRRIGYIRVSSFRHGMIQNFDAALGELIRRRVAGIVLDLRFNPGGLLPQAVAMVDRFVDSGLILKTITRHGAVDTYVATREATRLGPNVPVAVLVNGSSASAAEIVTGALQDHERAVIVGERTFGKGSVQHFIQLHGEDAGVRLTVAYYQIPSGRIIHKTSTNADSDDWGVTPDLVVPLEESEYEAIRRRRTAIDRQADQAGPPQADLDPHTGLDPDESPSIVIDRQLRAAVNSLLERVEG